MYIRYTLLVCLFLLGYATSAFAQRNLLESKATKEQVSQALVPTAKWISYPAYSDRTAWEKLIGNRKEAIVKDGEKYLNYEWKVVKATDYLAFERTGTRTIMEGPFNSNNTAIMHLFLAELTEGKGRFIDQLLNGVWHTCDMRSWVLSAHQPVQKTKRALPDENEVLIDLTSGDIGSLMSWIHYFLAPSFDKIDPVISARIRKEVKIRILDPYLERNDFWWQALSGNPDQMVNNWNPWCNFNVLAAFLLMEKDAARLTEAVHKTMRSVDRFIDYTKNDGACEEGPSYWGHAAGKMYDYLQLLSYATAGKIDIFTNPKIRAMGEYISRSYIGNGWVVNFADASAKGGGEASLVYRYGKATQSTEMQRFAAYLHQKDKETSVHARDAFRTLESLWSEQEISQHAPSVSSAPFTWYPQTQFCYMRSQDAFFGAKGGYNAESHNHNDVGSFIYYLKNTPLLIDAGVGTYTKFTFSSQRYSIWTMQSEYHNLPVINGSPQREGRQFRAKNVSFDETTRRFQLDISDAYPKMASVNEWLLSYQLTDAGRLTITETFSLKEAQYRNQLNFLSAVSPVLVEPGKIRLTNKDASALFTYDAATFDYSVLPVEQPDNRLSRIWGNTIYRIQLRDKSIRANGIYTLTLTPEK